MGNPERVLFRAGLESGFLGQVVPRQGREVLPMLAVVAEDGDGLGAHGDGAGAVVVFADEVGEGEGKDHGEDGGEAVDEALSFGRLKGTFADYANVENEPWSLEDLVPPNARYFRRDFDLDEEGKCSLNNNA